MEVVKQLKKSETITLKKKEQYPDESLSARFLPHVSEPENPCIITRKIGWSDVCDVNLDTPVVGEWGPHQFVFITEEEDFSFDG